MPQIFPIIFARTVLKIIIAVRQTVKQPIIPINEVSGVNQFLRSKKKKRQDKGLMYANIRRILKILSDSNRK